MYEKTLSVQDAANGLGESPSGQEQSKFTGSDVRRDSREGFREGCETEPAGAVGGLSAAARSLLDGVASAEEIEALETEGRIVRQRRRDGRLNRPQLVANYADQILSEAPENRFLVSSNYVGNWLVDRDLYPQVRRFNGIGDALGGHGLKLANVTLNNRRYYSLKSLGMTPKDKEAHNADLNAAETNAVRRLIVG
jgi:hypothetical protein